MEHLIGVMAADKIVVGLVEGRALAGPMRVFPPLGPQSPDELGDDIQSMPMDAVAETIASNIAALCIDGAIRPAAIGIGFPGIISDASIIEESPNLKQAKGTNLRTLVGSALLAHGIDSPIRVFNDADAMAAGVASTRGQTEKMIRVWTLGHGIGFGRYPYSEGVWEGGHMVVSLDPKECFCGCGGRGHLEGIMGTRSMRLRFLDLEPEEVFSNASAGEGRCVDFVRVWHRALAAASATSIHLEGPGKFFISGPNARFIQVNLLSQNLHEMVTMSPLQGSVFEVVPTSDQLAVIGAAINAARM